MFVDYHLHLWPHDGRATPPAVGQVSEYVEKAASVGIDRIGLTEHSHRFRQVDEIARGFWNAYDPKLAAASERVWNSEQGADLDSYCEMIQQCQQAGLPVELGVEIDLLPGLAESMLEALSQYPIELKLGSVHWLGGWLFDAYGIEAFSNEWDRRSVEDAWLEYETAMAELMASGLCNVLAHCDLIKVARRIPDIGFRNDFEDRLVELIDGSGLAVEVSSAGWGKPVAEQYPSKRILLQLAERNVPITMASDAHTVDKIGARYDDLHSLLVECGFTTVTSFEGGSPKQFPLGTNQ